MHGDCLELMKEIPDESVDLILCDPPYGTIKGMTLSSWTEKSTEWDIQLPTKTLFEEYERIIKVNCPIIIFSQEPYTSDLRKYHSYSVFFSYPMIWNKNVWSNPFLSKKKPLNVYEDISVFYKKYNNKSLDCPLRKYSFKCFNFIKKQRNLKSVKQINEILGNRKAEHFFRYNSVQIGLPTKETYQQLNDIFEIGKMDGYLEYNDLKKLKPSRVFNTKKAVKNIFNIERENERFHPTQKPIALLKQLIELYTNEGMVVLDNCMGSGSTGVACVNTNRNFIGIEKDDDYFKIAKDRIDQAEKDIKLDV